MKSSKSYEAYPMNGGDGLYSYTTNSSYQRNVSDSAKLLISEAIAEKLDIGNFPGSDTFRIADLGCSVGPNTFLVVQNIVHSVQLIYETQGHVTPEFQVLFNDHSSNDFNTLFQTLPIDKQYYVVGVPGSFYARLFSRASLHFVHSSFALHWLSKVPTEVTDKSSPAWNKGRIHYSNTRDEVNKAYSNQYFKDMESFLDARAQEIVHGGLLVIVVPGRPNDVPHSQAIGNMLFEILGSCLIDMAKQGLIDEKKIDALNIPIYYTSPQEMEEGVARNKCFTVERMESLPRMAAAETLMRAETVTMNIRAGLEGLFKEQFGDEIVDDLFHLYRSRLEQASSSIYSSGKSVNIFALLRRNNNSSEHV